MSDTETMTLTFGRRSHPEGLPAVWGARLIWPNDLVHNRQDLVSTDDDAKEALIHWLNTKGIREMQMVLGNIDTRFEKGIHRDMKFEEEVVIVDDGIGKIIGSAQASGGNFYVAGWLVAHEEALA
jgi:hypothetical protein